jgi:hypothetical protein
MKTVFHFVNRFFIAGLFFISCNKEKGFTPTPVKPPDTPVVIKNKPPIANAGGSQTISPPTSSVTLDGSGSSDPDGSIISYSWSQISGPNQSIIKDSTILFPAVNNLVVGTYYFKLTVTDNKGLSASSTVSVIVAPPTGPSILSGQEFVFDNLTWQFWDSGPGDPSDSFDEIFIVTPERPDLFSISGSMEVSLKFDTANNWIPIKRLNIDCTGYASFSSFPSAVSILLCGLDHTIVGKKASIKVKFL